MTLLVGTQRAVVATADDPLLLEHGRRLDHVEVAYETWGTLAPGRDNVVVVCHALTGDAHAAGEGGWWSSLVGPGRPVDTDRWFVVCSNLLGGCRGTTGPSSPHPGDPARAWGLDFPLLTVRDLVSVQRRLLGHLGIERVHAAVGGSLGGMQVLQWVLDDPAAIDRAVVVAASSRLTAQNIAFSAVAREAILRDPDFRDGQYAAAGVRPDRGLAVARRMAHITYVSEESLERKFGRDRVGAAAGDPPRHGTDFQVEAYLDHQAEVFLQRFDALSYLYLTRVMDYLDLYADPAAAARQAAGGTRFLHVSFDSDWRFPTAHTARTHALLAAAGAETRHVEVSSPWGHDSFLLDPPGYHDVVRSFVEAR
ncbi:homoserine O-acetyltransferase MetX [Nocardioides litoris]|uniref:homoserine O-acetyltransferase MetX n=1 Tax=Nocardioides litoris TaxID=1926648 RepID=UPI00111CFE4C|nr:homoserine O-acetyltransferase [Nocardioides litoris]